jgi:hypothetical protein
MLRPIPAVLLVLLVLVAAGCTEKFLSDPYARYDFAQAQFMKHSDRVIELKERGVLDDEDMLVIKPLFVAADAALTAYENHLLSPNPSQRGYSEAWDDFAGAIAAVLHAIDECQAAPEPPPPEQPNDEGSP